MKLTKEIISDIKAGKFDERLLDIYVDEAVLAYQRDRYVKAIEKFESLYGENAIWYRIQRWYA